MCTVKEVGNVQRVVAEVFSMAARCEEIVLTTNGSSIALVSHPSYSFTNRSLGALERTN